MTVIGPCKGGYPSPRLNFKAQSYVARKIPVSLSEFQHDVTTFADRVRKKTLPDVNLIPVRDCGARS